MEDLESRNADGPARRQTDSVNTTIFGYNEAMSQSAGMVIAAAIIVIGAVGLTSLAIFLAARKNEARRRAGPR